MSGLDGLGWPNPEDEPKTTTMNTDTPTPETDSAYIQCPNEGAWDFRIRQEKTMAKLERERDEARERIKNNPWCEACSEPDCCVSGDGTCAMIRKYLLAKSVDAKLANDDQLDQTILRLSETQERMIDAEMQRDRLIKSVEPLKYWRDISECDCSNPLPQGGCLRCDLNRILKTTNPNEL